MRPSSARAYGLALASSLSRANTRATVAPSLRPTAAALCRVKCIGRHMGKRIGSTGATSPLRSAHDRVLSHKVHVQ
jgi:hypothetical protein